MKKILVLTFVVLFLGCKESVNVDIELQEPEDKYEEVKAEIRSAYIAWGNSLYNRNAAKAFSYSMPNSAAEGWVETCKEAWDAGCMYYWDFEYEMRIQINDDWYARDYAEVSGNVTWNMGCPGEAPQHHDAGFHSSARKDNGVWKIDGINLSLEPDWWK